MSLSYTDVKLKNCPFYGSDEIQMSSDGGCQRFIVYCTGDNCTASVVDWSDQQHAIVMWNTRLNEKGYVELTDSFYTYSLNEINMTEEELKTEIKRIFIKTNDIYELNVEYNIDLVYKELLMEKDHLSDYSRRMHILDIILNSEEYNNKEN